MCHLSTLAKGRAATESFKDRYRVEIEGWTSGSCRRYEDSNFEGLRQLKLEGVGRKSRK